jgi:membrane protease YdiL (CAAX protease family)
LSHRSQELENEVVEKPKHRFLPQLAACLALYVFHIVVLTQHQLVLPVQLAGLTAVGYDSLAGAACFIAYSVYKRRKSQEFNKDEEPWRLPQIESGNEVEGSRRNWSIIRFRSTFVLTVSALFWAYFQTGRFSIFWEDSLFEMSAAGWPLTKALTRSLQVLLGHLSWVVVGSCILALGPRPPPFFQKMKGKFHWYSISMKSRWLWWTIGGYFVSSWFFNLADLLNKVILPREILMEATESVVTQLINPEHNDLWASIFGYVAPCVSAPVWEELLYRGFLLAGLTATTGSFNASCLIQSILFSAHHMSVTAAIPLAVLGYAWARLYSKSQNLLTVIIIHSMWNSRVFLGSWFGL